MSASPLARRPPPGRAGRAGEFRERPCPAATWRSPDRPEAKAECRGRILQEVAIPGTRRHIALVAHDNKKVELLRWAEHNRETLADHELYATGTTGTLLEFELGLRVSRFLSGPVGGDQQIGAKIAEGLIDVLVFFWDPLEPQPHDPDVKALLRLAAVWNIAVATNLTSADMIISSPLFAGGYRAVRPDFAPPAGPLHR